MVERTQGGFLNDTVFVQANVANSARIHEFTKGSQKAQVHIREFSQQKATAMSRMQPVPSPWDQCCFIASEVFSVEECQEFIGRLQDPLKIDTRTRPAEVVGHTERIVERTSLNVSTLFWVMGGQLRELHLSITESLLLQL